MSVSTLISQHGQTVTVAEPISTIGANGAVSKSYETTTTHNAFVQPRSASDADFAGAQRMRVGATFYFAGQVAFDTDAIISTDEGTYFVRSVRIPILRSAARDNSHTIVEADSVEGNVFPILSP